MRKNDDQSLRRRHYLFIRSFIENSAYYRHKIYGGDD